MSTKPVFPQPNIVEIVQAKMEGKEIQQKRFDNASWEVMDIDDWNFCEGYEFRIKPEPKYPKIDNKFYREHILNKWSGGANWQIEFANATIKQAIIGGLVLINPDYKE